MANDIITFVVGTIVGSLSTVAVFRSSVAVLQSQVTDTNKDVGKLDGQVATLERDLNGLGTTVRAELAHIRGQLETRGD